jgi:DNA-binding beta-propeller fold protein YncE
MESAHVVHLAADGSELLRKDGLLSPTSLSVNATDGSCWVADAAAGQVVHLSEDGAELWRGGGFNVPISVSVDVTDGSCWVADHYNNRIVHLAADGAELWRGSEFQRPWSVSVNAADGSCWVADTYNAEVVHLAADGVELLRRGGFSMPWSVSVNPSDGSCWVTDRGRNRVVRLAEDGTKLWQRDDFSWPWSVSVNAADGSCWVADYLNDEIVHLADDGTEVWRGGGFHHPWSVSVNPTDGSCWVADTYNHQIAHIPIHGSGECATPVVDIGPDSSHNPVNPGAPGLVRAAALGSLTFYAVQVDPATVRLAGASVAVDPGGGSYLVEERDVNEDGRDDLVMAFPGEDIDKEELADGYAALTGNTYSGTCFEGEDVVTIAPPDVPNDHWALHAIVAGLNSDLVKGYPDGLYRPNGVVTRDQMAVYIARGVAGGEAHVPAGPAEAVFPDVPTTHWAYDHVEYAVANDIVQGYGDGSYQPDLSVTRGQMAVFVARAIVDPTGEEGLADYRAPAVASYRDVPADYWSYRHVEYLTEVDVVSGYGDGLYRPTNFVTRDQMAVYVARGFELAN